MFKTKKTSASLRWKHTFTMALVLTFYSTLSHASFIQYFKDEEGNTKWQYVANFSSATLILLLSITAISLFFSHRRSRKANKALREIRADLEQRVLERTATLDESNRLLTEANNALEEEVSEHKETTALLEASEYYLNNILQSMPSMLIGLDDNLDVTHWNRCAEEISGVSYDKALHKNLWQVYPTITISPEQVSGVIEHNKPVTIKHSQRGQYYFDIRVYPLQGKNAKAVPGVVILIDNVTQRTLAENMLIQRDKMSSMGELASNMAHDINTPLQVIVDDLHKLQKTLTSESLDKATLSTVLLDAIDKGKLASNVIRNLLDFSRSQGDIKRQSKITDIIENALSLARGTLSEPSGLKFSDIVIEKNYEENLPELEVYVSELQQVFLSLLRHSSHSLGLIAKTAFRPAIKISVQECYDAIWIKIQHNGRGLTPEEQQELFEPFFNASIDAGFEGKPKGGDAQNRLSFSHFIISDHHKGQIAVTSDVDVGTTFHIQLELH
ncbi:Sensor protein FixL [Thalassocella blandensis]|nr:Sensor protein FixL [Thalassocella blandensis]